MRVARHLTHLALGAAIAFGISGCDRRGGAPGNGTSQGGETTGTAEAGSRPSGEPIVIGVAAPFTGNSAAFGTQIRKGVELAAERLNAEGGINGRPVELQMEDDTGTPTDASNVATTLASNDKVLAVVGHFNSACSNAGKPIYAQAGLVMFSPASTAVNVTQGSDFVFRNIFTDQFQGQSLADYAGKVLGFKKIAILYDNDDYGIGLKDSFSGRAKEVGLQIVSASPYNKDAVDYRSQLTSIQGTQPDAILVAGLYTQAATIAKQARELGLNIPIMGGDGVFSDEYIKLAGNAAEGSFITTPFLFELGGERAKQFADDFRKKFNAEPDAWAALSYDAFNLVTTGLKKNGATREAVLQYLKTINSPDTAYDGLTGKTYFDQEGDSKKPVQVATVKDGKFVAAEKQLSLDNAAAGAEAGAGAGAAEAASPTPEAAGAPSSTPETTGAATPAADAQTTE